MLYQQELQKDPRYEFMFKYPLDDLIQRYGLDELHQTFLYIYWCSNGLTSGSQTLMSYFWTSFSYFKPELFVDLELGGVMPLYIRDIRAPKYHLVAGKDNESAESQNTEGWISVCEGIENAKEYMYLDINKVAANYTVFFLAATLARDQKYQLDFQIDKESHFGKKIKSRRQSVKDKQSSFIREIYLKNIYEDIFPKDLRDFIQFCRRLIVKYIWISDMMALNSFKEISLDDFLVNYLAGVTISKDERSLLYYLNIVRGLWEKNHPGEDFVPLSFRLNMKKEFDLFEEMLKVEA